MHIDFRIQNIDPAGLLKAYIERRLRFALGRFGDRVGQVTVRMSGNANEKECRISTELRPFGRVAVRESDPDLFVAIDRATGRVGRLFGRELQRVRDVRRSQESIRIAA
jgi:ribosome-associated translation inhibitor RaiA